MFEIGRGACYQGDCVEAMRALPAESVHAVISDPPYGLSEHRPDDVRDCLRAWLDGREYKPRSKQGFMGATWDAWVPGPEVWREALRVLKPGGHLLAFAGTRSMDLMTMAIRLAGFDLRDSIGYASDGGGAPLLAWAYGSGFPKSLDAGKALDRLAGADAARKWNGFGTALKPAWEPIILARKPLIGTIAGNVMAHGCGALNIDAARVGYQGDSDRASATPKGRCTSGNIVGGGVGAGRADFERPDTKGRWPANLLHSGEPGTMAAFAMAGESKSGVQRKPSGTGGLWSRSSGTPCGPQYGDSGTAARFFERCPPDAPESSTRLIYCAKAPRSERGASKHPTVKPLSLLRYLCKLVTPPGGAILDPYAGSGSTLEAAILEGFAAVGAEITPEYWPDIAARLSRCQPAIPASAAAAVRPGNGQCAPERREEEA